MNNKTKASEYLIKNKLFSAIFLVCAVSLCMSLDLPGQDVIDQIVFSSIVVVRVTRLLILQAWTCAIGKRASFTGSIQTAWLRRLWLEIAENWIGAVAVVVVNIWKARRFVLFVPFATWYHYGLD